MGFLNLKKMCSNIVYSCDPKFLFLQIDVILNFLKILKIHKIFKKIVCIQCGLTIHAIVNALSRTVSKINANLCILNFVKNVCVVIIDNPCDPKISVTISEISANLWGFLIFGNFEIFEMVVFLSLPLPQSLGTVFYVKIKFWNSFKFSTKMCSYHFRSM